jgi:hypothetical protein
MKNYDIIGNRRARRHYRYFSGVDGWFLGRKSKTGGVIRLSDNRPIPRQRFDFGLLLTKREP